MTPLASCIIEGPITWFYNLSRNSFMPETGDVVAKPLGRDDVAEFRPRPSRIRGLVSSMSPLQGRVCNRPLRSNVSSPERGPYFGLPAAAVAYYDASRFYLPRFYKLSTSRYRGPWWQEWHSLGIEVSLLRRKVCEVSRSSEITYRKY